MTCDHANFTTQPRCPGCGMTDEDIIREHIDMLKANGWHAMAKWWEEIVTPTEPSGIAVGTIDWVENSQEIMQV